MKKVLSLVLVIAMVLSSMSFAFAGTFEDVTGDYEDAVDALVSLNVITGYEDGTFRPEKTITRAELAKVLVEALGYGDLVDGDVASFSDTNGHWATGYVAVAAGAGLVTGYPDGTFKPDQTVTYAEALTMVVRSLGYTDESLTGTWPTNFKTKAIDLGLTDDVVMASSQADRGGVAQIIYNALEAVLVYINSDGDITNKTNADGDNIILLSKIATLVEKFEVTSDKLDEDDKDYAGDKVDLAPYMYQFIDVYMNDDDEVVYVVDNHSEVVVGTVTAFDAVKKEMTVEDADEDEYTIKVEDLNTLFFNGEEETKVTPAEFASLTTTDLDNNAAKITVIGTTFDEINADGEEDEEVEDGDTANKFVVEIATQGILVDADYVTSKTKISGEEANIDLPENEDGDADLDAITVTGAVESLDEIVEGDVVVAYEAIGDNAAVKLVVVREAVEGTITKMNYSSTFERNTTLYIDGVSYKLSDMPGSIFDRDEAMDLKDEGTFYLDDQGFVFAADTDGADLTDYALVLARSNGTVDADMDGAVDKYPQIKLLTEAGDSVVYDVYVTVENTGTEEAPVIKTDDSATFTDKLGKDSDLVNANNTTLTLSAYDSLGKGTLVKYSVDEDGYLDAIELVTTSEETIDLDEVDDLVADDVVVFNTKDYEVSSVDNLIDNKQHNVVYSSGDITVIVTNEIESANDGVFGVIKSVNYTTNDDGDKVVEFKAFVDGVEVTYLSKEGVKIGDTNIKRTTTASAFVFDFNTSDEVEAVKAIVDATDKTKTIEGIANDVTSTKITIGETTKYFTSDCVVYIYDKSDDAITIGDISDLDEGAATTAYVTDVTSTSRVGIVVQVQP